MPDADVVLQDALALSEEERTLLTLRLLDSLESTAPIVEPDDPAWLAEIARRAEAAASGKTGATPWQEVCDRLEQRLGPPEG